MSAKSTREEIIEVAFRLVEASGVASMNIRGVAEAVGCSPSLVIRLFQSRAGLIGELFSMGHAEMLARAQAASAGASDPETRCMQVFDELLDFDLSRIELRREVMSQSWSLDPKVTDAAEREIQQILPLLMDIASDLAALKSYQARLDFVDCLWSRYEAVLKKHLYPGVDKQVLAADVRRRVQTLMHGVQSVPSEPKTTRRKTKIARRSGNSGARRTRAEPRET